MRQIKFRGKRLDNGEWVVGDLLHIARGCLIFFGSDTETAEPDLEKSSPIAVEFFKDEIAVIDPDTIGQFTGLCDANGRELYDGDIFTVNDRYPKLIEFRQDHAAFCMANISDINNQPYVYPWQRVRPDWWNDYGREITLIGNIHDNPELLNEK